MVARAYLQQAHCVRRLHMMLPTARAHPARMRDRADGLARGGSLSERRKLVEHRTVSHRLAGGSEPQLPARKCPLASSAAARFRTLL